MKKLIVMLMLLVPMASQARTAKVEKVDQVKGAVEPNSKKFTSFWNTEGHCGAGETSYPITTGGYGCMPNAN